MNNHRKAGSIFILGACGYLGSKLSKGLAANGYNLVLSSKAASSLENLKAQIRSEFPTIGIETIAIDFLEVSEFNALTSFLDKFSIEAFINCAALQGSPNKDVNKFSLGEFRNVLSVNLEVPVFLTYYFANKWQGSEKHDIIHFSGGGAASPRPLFNAYSLSKTALVRFVENCSNMEQFQNIAINTIAPGLMPSRMQTAILQDGELQISKDYENAKESFSQGLQSVEKTIGLCKFLLKQESVTISGKLISSNWDNWRDWPAYVNELRNSDVYNLRRITCRDRGQTWGDLQ